jgi:hypothetical protein
MMTYMCSIIHTCVQATITTISGSPRLWGAKAMSQTSGSGGDAAIVPASPVWTHRSEVAMIKSLDSGIKSGESTLVNVDADAPTMHASALRGEWGDKYTHTHTHTLLTYR